MKETNEIKIQETINNETGNDSRGVRIDKTVELAGLSKGVGALKDKIDHNQSVDFSDVEKLEKEIGKLTVDIGGEKFLIEELKELNNLKESAKIWEEVESGNFENSYRMTFITASIAERLSKSDDAVYLEGLITISDQVSEILSKHKGPLILNGLLNLSDQSAESLSKIEGSLYLNGLISLSDKVAESLAKHKGSLNLNSLASLSSQVAETLSRHDGDIDLAGLTSISDQVAEILSKYKSHLIVDEKIGRKINEFRNK